MKYLSLFSGIGGFEKGINQAYESNLFIWNGKAKNTGAETPQQSMEPATESNEYQRNITDNISSGNTGKILDSYPECVGFSEINPYAIQVYQSHFPTHHNYGDITQINADELPDFDLLVGGFPCQSFSIAGLRRGFLDTRGTLFFDIARVLKAKRPTLLLLENVKGLLSHDEGKTFSTIVWTLDELGYDLQWQVLNSKNHGVPQNRERVFIVGHLRGTPRPEVFPFTRYAKSPGEEIGKTIANTVTDGYLMSGKRPRHNGKAVLLPVGVRRIRRLTPTECARLQGFPDDWCSALSDTQAYKCYGNAVTVNVIKSIFLELLRNKTNV